MEPSTIQQITEWYHNLNELKQLGVTVGVVLATGIACAGGIVGIVNYFSNKNETQSSSTKLKTTELNQDSDYMPSSISTAIKTGEDSRIEGIIQEFYRLSEGHSGVISDSSGKVPFYISEDESIVPIIFNDSMKNQTRIKLSGNYDDDEKLFSVEKLEAKFLGVDYEI